MQNLVITNKGQELIASMIAGTSTAIFTKICTSDYDYSSVELEELVELQNIKQIALVSKVSRKDEMTVEILAAIDNSELTDSYYVRALGLYAKIGDGNEILYAVSIENTNPDYMPAFEGKTVSGISFKLNTKVDNSEQIMLEVNSATLPTIEQVEELYNMVSEIQKMTGDVDVTGKGNLQQQIADTQKACAKGEGIEFSVIDGILCVTYDDGTEEIEEEGVEE